MRTSFRKLWAIGLTFLVAAMSIFVPVSGAAFRDTTGHWAEKTIERWNEFGVVNGYDGLFRPDDSVTRAEFAKMLDNIFKFVETGENPFSDLDPSQWYYDAMIKLHAAGVMNGADGKAMPQNNITRQEAAVLIYRAFHLENDASAAASFTDEDQIADWAADAVKALQAKKIVSGFPDGSFRPQAQLTRAEAVTVFNNLIQDLISEPGEYSRDVEGNVVVNAPDVTLKDTSIAGNLYIAQGVGEGEVHLDNVVIDGTVYVFGGGENSIIFNNVTVKGALVVNKYNGSVRVLATGNTSVSVTVLESGALLVTRELTGGGFEEVMIPADIAAGQKIVLDGTFGKVVNRSGSVQIVSNGTIEELVAEADTHIEGDVKIGKVTAAEGASATLNGNPISSGTGGNNTGFVPGGGTGGGGSGGGSDDDDEEPVRVESVAINEKNIVLAVGETKQLTVDIKPANATNKNVVWAVADDSTDVVTVDENGLVTAHKVGTKTIKVVTEDGGKSDQTTVTVVKPAITVSVSEFKGEVVDASASIDEAVIANSESVSVVVYGHLYDDWNRFGALIVAEDEMLETNDPEGRYVYVVVTVKDRDGNPMADTSGLSITVTGAVYGKFGEHLADGFKQGSFVVRLDAGEPEAIRYAELTLSHEHYADTTLSLTYIPKGTPYISGIEAIEGDTRVGSKITAGKVIVENGPAVGELTYKWLRSEHENGPYAVIAGANAKDYVLTEEDSGKYIRVIVEADQIHTGGAAVSAAFGPVDALADAEEVFAAIEAVFLGTNADLQNIIADMNLVTSLPEYPGVAISWESDNPKALTNDGKVTRDEENDQFVQLTATLSGNVAGTKTKTYSLIVRAKGSTNVGIEDYIDPYFADGYPQAYVKDGNIWVKFKLKEPAEVYMVVNAMNGHLESDVQAVLEGRGGKGYIFHVDTWPYFNVDSSKVDRIYEFDTGVSLSRAWSRQARVEFVIRDKSKDYVSEQVTTIKFDQEVVGAIDTQPPYLINVVINKALDTIYLYFNERLDLDSVPQATDFELTSGEVTGVQLYNYSAEYAWAASYAKLSVRGIAEEEKDNLWLTYSGDALRDKADAKTKVETFNRKVDVFEASIDSVLVSSDRMSVIVELVPGWNPYDNPGADTMDAMKERVKIHVAGKGDFAPSSLSYYYGGSHWGITLKLDEPLPAGDVTVIMNTSGIRNWAFDEYPEELVSPVATVLPAPGAPVKAVYNQSERRIHVTFADGFVFDNTHFPAAGLVLKIDGTEYALRGLGVNSFSDNVLRIDFVGYDGKPENDDLAMLLYRKLEESSDIWLKYEKVHGDDRRQISDAAGALLPDFDYVKVEKQS